jgi:hypothetical protein
LKRNKNYLQHNARRKAQWLGRQPVHSAQKKEESRGFERFEA